MGPAARPDTNGDFLYCCDYGFLTSARMTLHESSFRNTAQRGITMMTKESLPMNARVGSGSTFSATSTLPKGLMQFEDFLQFEVR